MQKETLSMKRRPVHGSLKCGALYDEDNVKESIEGLKKEIGRRLPLRKEDINNLFNRHFGDKLT